MGEYEASNSSVGILSDSFSSGVDNRVWPKASRSGCKIWTG